MRERSRGGALDCVGKPCSAALWNHHALRARGERRTHNCAQIVRVFDTVKQHKQAICSFRSKQVVQLNGRFRGCERGHALMVARASKAIELLAVLKTHRNIVRFCDSDDFADAFAMPSAGDDDAVERPRRCERFFDGVKSADPVHFVFLIQRSAEFEHALARTFHGRGKRKLGGGIEQQNYAIEFAIARASRERKPDRVE